MKFGLSNMRDMSMFCYRMLPFFERKNSLTFFLPPDHRPPFVDSPCQTYTAGITGWNGTLYEALMTGLVPGASYQYMVGSPSLQVWSQVREG
jgi:hypothetical protein